MPYSSGSVMAVILTHDAPRALERCLAATAAQSVKPDAILVVDNASREPVDRLVAGIEHCSVLRMTENLGPAGGYAAGLEVFRDSTFHFAWVMDDDCVPNRDALEAQLAIASPDGIVLAGVQATGDTRENGHGWWGALIPHEIVDRVGVPNADLFWWTEDTEYLQWRIPQAGFSVRWTDHPVMAISRARADESKPAWKYYYESRNQVFHRLHVQRTHVVPRPENLLLRVRAWRAWRSVSKLAVRALLREREQRMRKLAMVVRGAFDGVRGKLGRTVPVDSAHRPLIEDHSHAVSEPER
jgi:hypothetical protein